MDTALTLFIEHEILPMYKCFDMAHREDHVRMVIAQSLEIARHYSINMDMVYAIAAFHDIGLSIDRKTHHLESGRIVRNDVRLKQWFSPEEIETVAQAVEDHRASSDHEPRSIYGKIVAEADRYIVPEKIIERTVQYGFDNYPELDKEGHWWRTLDHLHEKYAEGGYLKLWFPESPNVERLNSLREIIKNETRLRQIFERIYNRLIREDAHAVVETERMIIRLLNDGDLDALYSFMSKPEVMYAWEHGFTKTEVRQWINRQLTRYKKDGIGYFAVISKESGKLIGQAGLMRSEFNGTPVVELGYIFDNLCWHQGYATEASRTLMDYGFHQKHLDIIYCSIRPMNEPSIRVAERLGMKRCGEHIVNYRGQEMPHLIFAAESKK